MSANAKLRPMTLNLELPSETEARLRDIARANNLAIEEATAQALDQWMCDQSVVEGEEAAKIS